MILKLDQLLELCKGRAVEPLIVLLGRLLCAACAGMHMSPHHSLSTGGRVGRFGGFGPYAWLRKKRLLEKVWSDMTGAQTAEPTLKKAALRLWPGVVAAVLLVLVRFVVPIVIPEAMLFGVIGGLVGVLAVVLWWLFFSRAPWSERVGAIVLMIVALFATSRLVHMSIAKGVWGCCSISWPSRS